MWCCEVAEGGGSHIVILSMCSDAVLYESDCDVRASASSSTSEILNISECRPSHIANILLLGCIEKSFRVWYEYMIWSLGMACRSRGNTWCELHVYKVSFAWVWWERTRSNGVLLKIKLRVMRAYLMRWFVRSFRARDGIRKVILISFCWLKVKAFFLSKMILLWKHSLRYIGHQIECLKWMKFPILWSKHDRWQIWNFLTLGQRKF